MEHSPNKLLNIWFECMHLDDALLPSSKKKERIDVRQDEKTSKALILQETQQKYMQEMSALSMQKIQLHKAKPLQKDISDPLVQKTRQLADQIQNLQDLYTSIKSFDACPLKHTSINTVIFDGIQSSEVMLIGEAPGAQEDEKGIPFCGDSGKLLDAILSSIGLSRQKNVYITNTIFWRPPANRKPTDLEVATCKPFVEKHISLIQPKLLVLVGSTALAALCGQERQISKDRSQYYEYTNKYLQQPIKSTAIFHPAYLLRQPIKKKEMWFDILTIKKFLQGTLTIE